MHLNPNAHTLFDRQKRNRSQSRNLSMLIGQLSDHPLPFHYKHAQATPMHYVMVYEFMDKNKNSVFLHLFVVKAVDNLSAGEDYTFKLRAVKYGQQSAEVTVDTNSSKSN